MLPTAQDSEQKNWLCHPVSLFVAVMGDTKYIHIPLEALLLKASQTDIRQVVCVCPPAHRRSQPKRWQMTPDEHPQRHQLSDGPFLWLCAPSPSLRSCDAASVVMCCSARPASSSAPSGLPEDRIGRNIIYIRPFCDHINVLYIFDKPCIVSTLNWRSRTGPPDLFSSLVSVSLPDVSAKPMPSSHHFTPLWQV